MQNAQHKLPGCMCIMFSALIDSYMSKQMWGRQYKNVIHNDLQRVNIYIQQFLRFFSLIDKCLGPFSVATAEYLNTEYNWKLNPAGNYKEQRSV